MKTAIKSMVSFVAMQPYWSIKTRYKLFANLRKTDRMLEIGPGAVSIPGFETLNIVGGNNVDYVADASKKLPFGDATFNVVYASHVLEHIPWYLTGHALMEWVRVLKPGGSLELWVPDGLKICKAFADAEYGQSDEYLKDGWFHENPGKDPCIWASGRIFTYGDGTSDVCHPNWHRAVFSERLLRKLFNGAGLVNFSVLPRDKVRGADHGWINLGVSASKLNPI